LLGVRLERLGQIQGKIGQAMVCMPWVLDIGLVYSPQRIVVRG
jgi:hypothetical protein